MKKVNNSVDIPEINELFVMEKEDIEDFAECAAEAYGDYPLFKYLTNNSCDQKVIKTIVGASIKAMDSDIISVSTEENANAVAILVPPYYKGTKTIPFLFGGGLKLILMTSPLVFARLFKYEQHSMKFKKLHTNHESWYFYNLTVKPEYQHNGMASRLVKPLMDYLDRIGQSCYLETHDERNIGFYEHFGFELVDTTNIPDTDIKQYSMVRKGKKQI